MHNATPFHKVLIANRGEIALRVLRSARAAGYRTVAVYSTADAQARHVMEADQAVCIGGALPAESYLNIAALIDAAKKTGADAVHPGYGFLAENEDFAQACADAGLVFIGPSAKAIQAMGNKAGAKALMMAAGVPCVPGYQGDDQSGATLAAEAAQRIGWPVMIKAVAGGGGRGMRLVERADDFAAALASAQSEARNAFGDATVILERLSKAAPHRDPGAGRPPRQRHPPGRARLLGAAPAPEADRGSAVAGGGRRDCARAWARWRSGRQGHRLRRRGHAGIPARRRRPLLLHGDEHAAAGGAPGHRGHHRPGPGGAAAAGGRGRGAARGPARGAHTTATPSRCGCVPKTPPRASCRRAARWRCGSRRMACAWSMR
jgi:hypothetical protein